jgi:hypothetical protein
MGFVASDATKILTVEYDKKTMIPLLLKVGEN